MIRLIGFDLDGTLLTDDKRVTPRTRAVLASCAARGIALVPVTGRPFSAIPGEVLALPGVRYAAAASGADIRDLLTGEILNRDVIPTATALTILRALEEADVIIAKGQGNCETLYGCEWNVYFAFLVKCSRFIRMFNRPKFTPMLTK